MIFTPAFKQTVAQAMRNTSNANLQYQNNMAQMKGILGAGALIIAPLFAMSRGGFAKGLGLAAFGLATSLSSVYTLQRAQAFNQIINGIANQISPQSLGPQGPSFTPLNTSPTPPRPGR